MNDKKVKTGADLVVDTLINQGVEYVFGVPGAKIDPVFNALHNRGPETIVCHHEQNAAFIAAGYNRIKDEPGVVLVTSGPGVLNLPTGLGTATEDGDSVVAIAGNAIRVDRTKKTHQSMENADVFRSFTKYSKEVLHQNNISEVLSNAFRESRSGYTGSSLVSLPSDILMEPVNCEAVKRTSDTIPGAAATSKIAGLVEKIKKAKLPVLFLGMHASKHASSYAVRELLKESKIPVVETFQGAGAISRELEEECFFGRVGLWKNQPGDTLLKHADLIITVGFNPVEYDPRLWNAENPADIVHICRNIAEVETYYQPSLELIGDIASTIKIITKEKNIWNADSEAQDILKKIKDMMKNDPILLNYEKKDDMVHPLELMEIVRRNIDDKTIVCCDVGSLYIWMARYFRSYNPRTLLFTNGLQTLGVGMPWAIGAYLADKSQEKIISMSGDGGFLFSAMELATAVRLKVPLVHIIWNDNCYDMVKFQQLSKFKRKTCVDLGYVDFVKYAESFGAIGYRATNAKELEEIFKKSLKDKGPVIIDLPINYEKNADLSSAPIN